MKVFDSILPLNIDWEEICEFFNSNSFRGEIMSENWKSHTVFKTFPLSEKSMKVLECLHNDLYKCYHNAFVKHEDGTEDRAGEYRLLQESLFSKYENISDNVLQRIYSDYLISDR